MGTINEPFLVSNRFEVAFVSTVSRYKLVLSISGMDHNYVLLIVVNEYFTALI